MGVVNTKSALITARDGATIVSGQQSGGILMTRRGFVTSVIGDSIGSTYRILPVRSSESICGLAIFSAAQGASVTGNVGLYRTARDGGAVVSVSLFATLVDLAAFKDASILHEELALSMFGKRVWEMLGLASDPQVSYDIVLTTAGAAIGTAGVVAMAMQYTDG